MRAELDAFDENSTHICSTHIFSAKLNYKKLEYTASCLFTKANMSSISSFYSSVSDLSLSSVESNPRLDCKRRYGPESDYQWQIENFSMCPLKKGEFLVSTSFTVDSLDQSEYRLVLYPRGLEGDSNENVTCFVECLNESDFRVLVQISIQANKSLNETKTQSLSLGNGKRVGFVLLTDRQVLVSRRFFFLPNDVFTIRCVITPEYRASYICDEDFLNVSNSYRKLLESGMFSDFTIIGPGNERIPVHKVILTIRCNELAKKVGLLDENPVKEAKIDDMSLPALKVILYYLYVGNLPDGITPAVLNEVYKIANSLKMDDLKRDVFPLESSIIACTSIKIDRRFISWVLNEFPQRMLTGAWPMRTFIDLTLGRFVLSFYIKEKDGKLVTLIDVYSHCLMLDSTALVKCTVYVANGCDPKPELCSGEHYFDSDREGNVMFSMIGNHDLLYTWRSLRQYPETVGLLFDFTLSNPLSCTDCRNVEVTNTLNTPRDVCKRSYQRLSSDLDIVFGDTCYEEDSDSDSERDPGTFSDLVLKTQDGKCILSHRCILSARSDVFRDMIVRDGADRLCNTLDLKDMSDATLMNLLRYMYSGKIKEKSVEKAVALYIAASKYKVHALVKRCVQFIKTEMTINDVYRLLLLADEHKDGNLFDALLGFIYLNQAPILSSEEWFKLIVEKSQLASRVLAVLSSKVVQST